MTRNSLHILPPLHNGGTLRNPVFQPARFEALFKRFKSLSHLEIALGGCDRE
jgi:hypothetical protein